MANIPGFFRKTRSKRGAYFSFRISQGQDSVTTCVSNQVCGSSFVEQSGHRRIHRLTYRHPDADATVARISIQQDNAQTLTHEVEMMGSVAINIHKKE